MPSVFQNKNFFIANSGVPVKRYRYKKKLSLGQKKSHVLQCEKKSKRLVSSHSKIVHPSPMLSHPLSNFLRFPHQHNLAKVHISSTLEMSSQFMLLVLDSLMRYLPRNLCPTLRLFFLILFERLTFLRFCNVCAFKIQWQRVVSNKLLYSRTKIFFFWTFISLFVEKKAKCVLF